ncbi:MAG: hypothetical protein ACRDSP_10110 [Pseudonocardiaceae bacterium]
MNSRRRVNAALIGLILLVIGVWFVQHGLSGQHLGGWPGVLVSHVPMPS